jgi:uncharacterized RDD family membrane protein YckC
MTYDALLLTGLAFVVSYVMLASLQWSYPMSALQRFGLQAVLFVALGAFLVICWTRTGQTLGMKAWRLKVVDSNGRLPRTMRAIARYVLAWHLWVPGLALAALTQPTTTSLFVALAAGFALLMLPALLDPQRRLMHDRWTGTRLVRI